MQNSVGYPSNNNIFGPDGTTRIIAERRENTNLVTDNMEAFRTDDEEECEDRYVVCRITTQLINYGVDSLEYIALTVAISTHVTILRVIHCHYPHFAALC